MGVDKTEYNKLLTAQIRNKGFLDNYDLLRVRNNFPVQLNEALTRFGIEYWELTWKICSSECNNGAKFNNEQFLSYLTYLIDEVSRQDDIIKQIQEDIKTHPVVKWWLKWLARLFV